MGPETANSSKSTIHRTPDGPKRFFESTEIDELFENGWISLVKKEKTLVRYAKEKRLWEFALRKRPADERPLELRPHHLLDICAEYREPAAGEAARVRASCPPCHRENPGGTGGASAAWSSGPTIFANPAFICPARGAVGTCSGRRLRSCQNRITTTILIGSSSSFSDWRRIATFSSWTT